jgi:hypothetical protein
VTDVAEKGVRLIRQEVKGMEDSPHDCVIHV